MNVQRGDRKNECYLQQGNQTGRALGGVGGGGGLVGSVYGQFGNDGRLRADVISGKHSTDRAVSTSRECARRTAHGLQLNVCFITRISAIRNWFREYFAQREEKLRLFLTRRKRRSFLTKEVGGLHF